jgi:alkylation response protein AidB-like acyl-CoA dehydrogenase
MDFNESGEMLALRDTLKKFAAKECTPEAVAKWDREDLIPREMATRLGKLGVFGMCVPEEYGGLGRQVIGMTVVLEELSRVSVAVSGMYNMGASYGGLNISESGSKEQKERAAAADPRRQNALRLRAIRTRHRGRSRQRQDARRTSG